MREESIFSVIEFGAIVAYDEGEDEPCEPALEGDVEVLVYEADDPSHRLDKRHISDLQVRGTIPQLPLTPKAMVTK